MNIGILALLCSSGGGSTPLKSKLGINMLLDHFFEALVVSKTADLEGGWAVSKFALQKALRNKQSRTMKVGILRVV